MIETTTKKHTKEIFKEYDPIEDKLFQIMDNQGAIINPDWIPDIDDENIKKAYRDMLFARTADSMAISYQRQGRMYTYPPNFGQEAIAAAVGKVMREDDWLIPAFREMGTYLAKGVSMKELFMYFMGYEEGTVFRNAKNTMPMSVPIASQFPHAVGIAYALKYRKEDKVAFAFVGDGGTSTGDFHEAMNFAGVWKIPGVFIIQNNQFAISVPIKRQTNSINLAAKSVAYGIKGIKVDGNDYFAMHKAVQEAADYARAGNGPVLIEALTYRKGAHTTSDDPTKYRTKEEEELWHETDPLNRIQKYLASQGLWTEGEDDEIVKQYKKEIDRQFEEAENYGLYPHEDIFKYTYTEMPEELKNQQIEHEKYLKWKEARK